ncbi:MAG: Bax inhibitor-1/YccA family protein [Pseudomonadota bacterium]|nr:Bax inhibitor-1/YccA family protein [Pseudomonadota bacterium]
MNQVDYNISHSQTAVMETNKVLRNTYLLLSMTLLFSAVTAGISMAMNLSHGVGLVLLLVSFGLMFWVHKAADSANGLLAIFVFTGCMGAALGPILNHYLAFAQGPSLIFQALGGTALIFLALSGYALTTKKDFSFMRGFLTTGLIVMLVGGLVLMFTNMPMVQLAWSAMIVLLMSGLILFDTSRIIHGGETNYIRATVGLYLSIYNLFTSLLHLLGAFGGDE